MDESSGAEERAGRPALSAQVADPLTTVQAVVLASAFFVAMYVLSTFGVADRVAGPGPHVLTEQQAARCAAHRIPRRDCRLAFSAGLEPCREGDEILPRIACGISASAPTPR